MTEKKIERKQIDNNFIGSNNIAVSIHAIHKDLSSKFSIVNIRRSG